MITYMLLTNIDNDNIYTFNQYNRVQGSNMSVGYIDTAMVMIPFGMVIIPFS